MWDESTPPYKYKGPWPIVGYNPIESIKYIYLLLSLPFIFILAFPTSTCCSSLVSMVFEDALASLPSLGQPKLRLPRRVPSGRAFVGSSLGCPDETGPTGAPYRSDRLVLWHCKERRCSPCDRARSCVGPESAPTDGGFNLLILQGIVYIRRHGGYDNRVEHGASEGDP